jgi:hypothetical protein
LFFVHIHIIARIVLLVTAAALNVDQADVSLH